MRTPRFSLMDQARMLAVAAVLASGVTFLLVGLVDPFGRSARAARDATEVVLCAQIASNQQRLGQLELIVQRVGKAGLTRNERDVLELQRASHGRLTKALQAINGECKGAP